MKNSKLSCGAFICTGIGRVLFALVLIFFIGLPIVKAQTADVPQNKVCGVTKQEIDELNKYVQRNIVKLKHENKLNFERSKNDKEVTADNRLTAVQFRWPLTTSSYRDFASWSIMNFVDLDPDGDGDDNDHEDWEIEDYNCGNRTYDGHQGIDILVHPYRWEVQNSGSVHVVAAARGVIVFRHDGEFDENCGDLSNYQGSTGRGNNVVILHDDGTTASFYMHMKSGSLTNKTEGDFIEAGEYLGTVASAGRSSEPHLHFQVNTGYVNGTGTNPDNSGDRIDPFFNGSCKISSSSSWISELPYNDPAVLTLETHGTAPGHYSDVCDKTVTLNHDNSFFAGQVIYFRSQMRDWIDGSTITHRIYKPDGTTWKSYSRTNTNAYRNYFPADQSYTVSISDPSGTYRYTVTFGGKTYSHYFTINCEQNKTLSGATSGHKGYMVSNTISSTQTLSGAITNYVKYLADQKVVLNPGFKATSGCRFVANTEGCSNSSAARSQGDTKSAARPVVSKVFNQEEDEVKLTIAPNPSTGVFSVIYKGSKTFSGNILVRNMLGQIVHTIQKKHVTQLNERIDLTRQPGGMYIVELTDGDKKMTQKVMIQ